MGIVQFFDTKVCFFLQPTKLFFFQPFFFFGIHKQFSIKMFFFFFVKFSMHRFGLMEFFL